MPSWSIRSPWTSIIGASPCRWLIDGQRPETSGESIRIPRAHAQALDARPVLMLDMSEHMFYYTAHSTRAAGREELLVGVSSYLFNMTIWGWEKALPAQVRNTRAEWTGPGTPG